MSNRRRARRSAPIGGRLRRGSRHLRRPCWRVSEYQGRREPPRL